jgi:hypothetical protein
MKIGMAILALGSILYANGAAMPLAPGNHVIGELEHAGAVVERVQYRTPRELSRDRYRGRVRDGYRPGYLYGYGFGTSQWRGGVGVYRQPPSSSYTRRNFPYAYGDTFGYWPDVED